MTVARAVETDDLIEQVGSYIEPRIHLCLRVF